MITRVMTNLSGTTIAKFIARFVRGGSMLMTDECRDYALVRRIMRQDAIQHNKRNRIGLTFDKFQCTQTTSNASGGYTSGVGIRISAIKTELYSMSPKPAGE